MALLWVCVWFSPVCSVLDRLGLSAPPRRCAVWPLAGSSAGASRRVRPPSPERRSMRLCHQAAHPTLSLSAVSLRARSEVRCPCSGDDSVCVCVRWASAVLWRGLLSVWQASGCFWHFSVPCGLLVVSHLQRASSSGSV